MTSSSSSSSLNRPEQQQQQEPEIIQRNTQHDFHSSSHDSAFFTTRCEDDDDDIYPNGGNDKYIERDHSRHMDDKQGDGDPMTSPNDTPPIQSKILTETLNDFPSNAETIIHQLPHDSIEHNRVREPGDNSVTITYEESTTITSVLTNNSQNLDISLLKVSDHIDTGSTDHTENNDQNIDKIAENSEEADDAKINRISSLDSDAPAPALEEKPEKRGSFIFMANDTIKNATSKASSLFSIMRISNSDHNYNDATITRTAVPTPTSTATTTTTSSEGSVASAATTTAAAAAATKIAAVAATATKTVAAVAASAAAVATTATKTVAAASAGATTKAVAGTPAVAATAKSATTKSATTTTTATKITPSPRKKANISTGAIAPLNCKWCIWLDHPKIAPAGSDFKDKLKLLGTIQTVEGFWRIYNNMKPASELSIGSNYSIFRYPIEPSWEDSHNVDGGKFVITIPKKEAKNTGKTNDIWLLTVLAVIGETMDLMGDQVNGTVVSLRKHEDRVSLWLKSSEPNICVSIGERWKKVLNIEKMKLKYVSHRTAAATGRSFRNEAQFEV